MDAELVEKVSAEVHAEWMRNKRAKGIESRLSERGEELMRPYDSLSEEAKELNRGSVRAVLRALDAAGYVVYLPKPPPTGGSF